MLETLRAFALEELVSANLFFSLQQMHAEYFAEYAQVVFKEILGENSAHWLAKTHLDHDNFRAALRFALEQNNGDLAVSLAGGLWWFWGRQGFVREAMTWLEASLHCATSEPFDDEKKRRRVNALNGAGSTATELNDFDSAMAYHQEGLQLRQELQDKKGISTVLHNMGLVAQCQGDYPRAIQWMEESLGLVDPADKRSLAMSYANLGVVALLMNDLSNSQNWLERALETVKATEYPWETAFAANCLATVFFEQGNFERSEEMGLKSMALFKEMGDLLYIPEPQLLLAKLSHLRGDLAKAQALSLEALNQYQEMEDQHGVANALHVLAWIALAEDPTLTGASRATDLFNESKALRNTVKRNLSPLEQSENQRLQAAIEQHRSSKS
jgi:tetratricopeptide (TPR) repeat protein